MVQQTQVPASQTVEPVRQPRGPPSSLKTEEGLKNYYVAEYLKEVGLLNKEDLDSDYPVKPFQRSRPQRSNVSNRIDRLEDGINETQDTVKMINFRERHTYENVEFVGKQAIAKEVVQIDR